MENQKFKEVLFFNKNEYYCPLDLIMHLIGGKWKMIIMANLIDGAARSGELQRAVKGISNKMFAQAIRELEIEGLVKRTIYPVVPPKVEYELTEIGTKFIPTIKQLALLANEISE